MGSRNQGWAIANQAGLSDRAARLLMFMAWHTMDTPRGKMPANVYARGWSFAAELMYPDLKPHAAEERIRRALVELVNAGKVKPLGQASKGRRQNYQLMP